MSSFSTLSTLILAGGLGTRLKSLVSDRPKVMANINGRPFIYYLLDFLDRSNISKVTISTGFMSDIIENNIGSCYKGIEVNYSKEQSSLGTAGALKFARKSIDTKHLLIMNGDSYVQYNMSHFFEFHINKKANISILVKNMENRDSFGSIKFNSEKKVLSFLEKSTKSSGYVNAGVYIMDTSMLDKMPDEVPYSIEYDYFPSIINKNLFCYETKGDFIDIGTPESYSLARSFFKNQFNPISLRQSN